MTLLVGCFLVAFTYHEEDEASSGRDSFVALRLRETRLPYARDRILFKVGRFRGKVGSRPFFLLLKAHTVPMVR